VAARSIICSVLRVPGRYSKQLGGPGVLLLTGFR
jgi:hypothetical protein